MLQIATGKLFTRPVGRQNHLRGMLYTNAIIEREVRVETSAGCLIPSSSYSIHPQVIIYEFIERMEEEEIGPGVLVSSTVDPYLQDYAAVVSFALNCTCTPDVDLTRRLTSGHRGLATRSAPQNLVRKFFDKEYWCQPHDLVFLKDFTDKLIGLPRITFLGVMRALRTYINGMHRVADDLELAYTLLVASVESLAQDFDGHESDWESFDSRKRKAIDEALAGADEQVAQRVREALLKVEHVALARRFREFVVTHVKSDYFRQALGNDDLRLARSDLIEAVGLAYKSRSQYVHQLMRLPDMVTMGHGYSEKAINGRATHLTLQGLSRLMREVIIEFVMRQPSLDHEPYNYKSERSGVVRVPLAPQYWVGRSEGDITNGGRKKLEGFLQQLAPCLLKSPDAVVTDLRPVLTLAAEFIPNIETKLRLPYLALHALFNATVQEQERAETSPIIRDMIQRELVNPSPEALIVFALFGEIVPWSIEDHHSVIDKYFRRRSAENGIRFPQVFEAAIMLELAERYRIVGNIEKCQEVVGFVVENYPGHSGLLEFEKTIQLDIPMIWRSIVLPK